MSTRLLAELEAKINEWITKNCDSEDWPDEYVHENLERQMASAAYSVFSSSMDAQKYAKQQNE